jgi:histone acetyltransferase MYST1
VLAFLQLCCIKAEDVITTLQYHGMIQYHKGQHVICAAPALIERCLQKAGSPGCLPDPSKIVWTPYDASKEYQMYSTK